MSDEKPPRRVPGSPRSCPTCGRPGASRDTRDSTNGTRRRRYCETCRVFWTTLEVEGETPGGGRPVRPKAAPLASLTFAELLGEVARRLDGKEKT